MFKSINGGILPCRFTRHSAGFDVFSNEDITIGAGETVLVGLGICLDDDFCFCGGLMHGQEYMSNHYLELHPRSSLRAKGLGGGVGIIDIDYRDEIKMVISNPLCYIKKTQYCDMTIDLDPLDNSKEIHYQIKKGDKIGQLILKRHEGWLLPSEYTKDDKRVGGFGSTDNNIDERNVNASRMMGIIK